MPIKSFSPFPANEAARAFEQAVAMLRVGRHRDALALAEQLIPAVPANGALFNLAALAARAIGSMEKAEIYWRSAITAQPGFAAAYNDLGMLLKNMGRYDEAEIQLRKALELQPGLVGAQVNLGNLYRAAGRLPEAEAAYRQALAHQPDHVDALYNLGLLLAEQERTAEAEAAFRQSLAAQPAQADVYNDLGSLLATSRRDTEAEAAYREAVRLRPNFADAHFNLAVLLLESRRHPEALAALRRALDSDPRHANALNCFGNVMKDIGQFEKAEMAYRRALELQPDSASVHNNLGNLLMESDKLAAAEEEFRRAMVLQPNYGHAIGQALTCARQRYAWDTFHEDGQTVIAALDAGVEGIPALMVQSLPEADAGHRRQAGLLNSQNQLRPFLEMVPLVPPTSYRMRDRLRIGYISADFREHAVMHLATGVFEAHDRKRFDIYAYSLGPDTRDAYRQRVEKACETFRDLRQHSSAAVAQQIVDDGVDILVDLGGYTTGSRPEVSAMRPAPLIVSWLGFPGTLGHPRLADYLIGDAVLTPLEHQSQYSETLALMPCCYQPNDRDLPVAVAPDRSGVGLPAEGFVFCSFNQGYKLNPDTFTVWCRLLTAVPGSVLWLLEPKDKSAINNLLQEAKARDIPSDRLVFAPAVPLAEHLARLGLADLALDTFPYGSGATGSNMLRAGVPMITRRGESYVSRMAASQLHAVGLPELVTADWESYFEIARALALNPDKQRALRDKLAANLPTAPLFNTARFTRDLEALYLRMWSDHASGTRQPITLA